MRKRLEIPKRALASLVDVDPESICASAPPDLEFLYVDIAGVSEGRVKLPAHRIRLKEAPSRARRLIRSGDVLMSTVRPNLKAFAHCELPADLCVASTGFAVLRPRDTTDSRYVLYSILSDEMTRQIDRLVAGSSYPAITSSDVKRLQVPDFDPLEQRAIAQVLSTVDETIQQTEMLIAKMQQVKSGMMRDLFTRGVTLDGALRATQAEAPELYKQTSIGWLPEEWTVHPLGRVSEIASGVTLTASHMDRNAVTVPYLRVANVQDGYLDLSEVKTIAVPPHQLQRLRLKSGDVLMNEGGDYDKLGRGCVWEGAIDPCIHQNHVFRVRPNSDALQPRYLAYWSQSEFGRRYFIVSSKQSTNLASINSTQLHRFPVALPPLLEQIRLQEILDCVAGQTNALQDELAKLRDVKRGLMHDLLTGRVRV